MSLRSSRTALIMAVALGAASIGCESTAVRFEAPRSPIAAGAPGRPVQAKRCGFQLLLFIPISINSRAADAYDQLKMQAGDDLLTDVRVSESWFWGLVGTGYCTEISATIYPHG